MLTSRISERSSGSIFERGDHSLNAETDAGVVDLTMLF